MHLSVETVVDDELMCHFYPERLHRMLLPVEVGTDFSIVEIGDSAWHTLLSVQIRSNYLRLSLKFS